jgi:TonB family protein
MQGVSSKPMPYKDSSERPRFLVPLVVLAISFGAILTVPRLFRHGTDPLLATVPEKSAGRTAVQKPAELSKPNTSATSKTVVAEKAKSLPPGSSQTNQRTAQPVASETLKHASEKEKEPSLAPVAPVAAVATEKVAKSGAVGSNSSKGEVLDQVLPDVSEKARATIHGRVKVSVKVHVDPAGGVSGAEFDSPGPSKFFADLAMKAARKWAFTSPEVNGKSVASEWRLRFEFTQQDTKVAPAQIAPL